jgi:hypothetical protein
MSLYIPLNVWQNFTPSPRNTRLSQSFTAHLSLRYLDTATIVAKNKQTNFATFGPQANFTNWAAATGRRILVLTFVDRRVSRGQRGGSPTAVNLSFLDRSRYFSLK